MNNLHTAHYRLLDFLPCGVFLNAIAIFFRFNLPLRYRKRGFLLLAFTYLFQALSLRLPFLIETLSPVIFSAPR